MILARVWRLNDASKDIKVQATQWCLRLCLIILQYVESRRKEHAKRHSNAIVLRFNAFFVINYCHSRRIRTVKGYWGEFWVRGWCPPLLFLLLSLLLSIADLLIRLFHNYV